MEMHRRLFCRILIALSAAGLIVTGSYKISREKNMPIKTAPKYTNRLINETSPYLLQHAHNPVDWYPWGREAFERAEKQDKPIFLSIGYSTCHWCHVMERESFEDEQTAGIMNKYFVNIKVDREHRPDIDSIYMNAVQMMTGSGGWPLSVFLTPEGKPFFGGTYFPPKDIYGRPGFEKVLLSIADAWKDRRQQLIESSDKISEVLSGLTRPGEKERLSPKILKAGFDYFKSTFDSVNGGFGSAPKFPQPTNLSMLLSYWYRTKEDEALKMVEKTLDAMAGGGIYDHIGGGFHRYSTDERWLVPHFEKMLYDQAQLSRVYIEAYQVTGRQEYAATAREIFDYVLRDMTDSRGGFYSAEDADSEGKEGAFYVWETEQIESVLDEEEAEIFAEYYGVTKEGNFEDNKTILNVSASKEQLAKKFQKDSEAITEILTNARRKVFKARQKRIRPHRDDKIITSWNGLMISSMAYGGAVLQQEKYVQAARRAAKFIMDASYKNGRLMRYYRDERAIEPGFVDDYAFVITALLELYQASFESEWLVEAKTLAEQMIELFGDDEHGGFFLTGKDSEKLIARIKPSSDGVIPSGNSASALVLLKLGRLTMNQSFTERGVKVLESFSQQLKQSPGYSSEMLSALNFRLGPSQEIVIAGDADAADTEQMLELVYSKYLPNAVILLHPNEKRDNFIEETVPFVSNLTAVEGKATAYLCEDYTCKQPVSDTDDLEKLLCDISAAQQPSGGRINGF
jgi:hypothetical protein